MASARAAPFFPPPPMRVVFVHGWSVTNTDTYGGLPAVLARPGPSGPGLAVDHLHLARFVSFADEVTLDDLARAMEHALAREVLPRLRPGERFACVTHSTGGPLVRLWLELHHARRPERCPLSHLVMLAPPNHGSALAQLGSERLARLKSFVTEGVQPGLGVLAWLELGSAAAWGLARSWIERDWGRRGVHAFVLTGQRVDRRLYDALNSYSGETGSDGVVRVASADLNPGYVRFEQEGTRLVPRERLRGAETVLAVLPGLAHSGERRGILRSVQADDDGSHPTVAAVRRCLAVRGSRAYAAARRGFAILTDRTQRAERVEQADGALLFRRTFRHDRHALLLFRVRDDRGQPVTDFELRLTAGPAYDANHLPPGFCTDRQRNRRDPSALAYYLNHDVLAAWFARPELGDRFGLEVEARPTGGYAGYAPAAWRGRFSDLRRVLGPNRTTLVEVVLERRVGAGAFQLGTDLRPADFRRQPPGSDLPFAGSP